MNKPKISTIIIIICILIIGLYAMGEVNYFASKIAVERNIESPVIVIPSAGIEEKINNETLNQGVLIDPAVTPTENAVLLYGHRTLQGSPFLMLHNVKIGDELLLEWPGVGEINYTVKDTYVVPADYEITNATSDEIYLITCDPIGSTENRLIIEGKLTNQNPINNEIIKDNPQENNAIIISAIFLVIGLVFSYFYPADNRIYILVTVVIVAAVLFYFCFNPIPSEIIMDKIIFLNGGL